MCACTDNSWLTCVGLRILLSPGRLVIYDNHIFLSPMKPILRDFG